MSSLFPFFFLYRSSLYPSLIYTLFVSLSLCVYLKTCQAGDLCLIQHPDTRCVRQTRCQSLHMQ